MGDLLRAGRWGRDSRESMAEIIGAAHEIAADALARRQEYLDSLETEIVEPAGQERLL